jgi:hypothetical protein
MPMALVGAITNVGLDYTVTLELSAHTRVNTALLTP